MTAAPLAPRDVAAARGVEVGSVYRYLTESRRRAKTGEPLRPRDIPLPDLAGDGQLPRWLPDGPIAAWIARTAQTSRKDTA